MSSSPESSFGQGHLACGPTALFTTSNEDETISSKFLSNARTAASEGFGLRARNIGPMMVVGDVVVPLCSNLDKRQSLAQIGLYAGVEYIICNMEECTGSDSRGERLLAERIVTLQPAYPLRSHLERSDWPISLSVSDVPLWLSKTTYEAGTALGTLLLAGIYLTIALVLSTVLRIVSIASESMEPALMPGDVVLVTRSVFTRPKVNDVVFFNPPSELDDVIAKSKVGLTAAAEKVTITSTKGKQFLKRVVGVPGDRVGVWNSNPYVILQSGMYQLHRTGEYSRPDLFPDESWNRVKPTINVGGASSGSSNEDEDVQTLSKGEYFVAGDNGFRSVDSRVWGPLKQKYIFGTADWVIYPMKHFGPIQPGPFSVEKGIVEKGANNL